MSVSQSAPDTVAPDEPAPPEPSRPILSEDWLATIGGLVILVLVLAGVITKGMIP